MKRGRIPFCVCAAPLLLSAVLPLFLSCNGNVNAIRRMQQLEEGVDNPVSAEELEEAIAKYQNRVEDIIQAEVRTANWYKLLAIRYLDNRMYGKALENFQGAVEYHPDNQNLFYYVGVCAGFMSKASLDYTAAGGNPMRERYLDLAESAYLRALEIEPRFARALYGIAILYAFEKHDPERALPYIEQFTEIETKDNEAQIRLAQICSAAGQTERAISVYDKVIRETTNDTLRAVAESNRAFLLEDARSHGAD